MYFVYNKLDVLFHKPLQFSFFRCVFTYFLFSIISIQLSLFYLLQRAPSQRPRPTTEIPQWKTPEQTNKWGRTNNMFNKI